jgi:NADH:ubiquinone oxidoreductase subunit D/NADH:ubiquinone oxidoreductase subunit C
MTEATAVAEAPANDLGLEQDMADAVLGTWAEDTEAAFVIAPDRILDVLTRLRDASGYDFLSNLTCIDYQGYGGKLRAGIDERLEVVYNLYSTSRGGGSIALHVRVPEDDTIPSATSVYPGANLQEREVYDLYGVKFEGHPNLRRILLWDGFNGHPMRKDWHEAYYEEDAKPFRSRHPKGEYEFQEDKLPWAKNTTYPAGWDPDSWEQAVAYVPVSQAPQHENEPHLDTESIVVNLGPHHPSTHGVFRMLTRVEGETILALEPEMGYLHRNHEKIGERNTWLMNMPYTDRLDYLNSMSNNWSYALAVEKLAGIEVPEHAMYLRVISAELQRIASHLMATGFLLNDMGAFATPLMYCFRERERILDLFEMLCGARITLSYMRPGGVFQEPPEEFWPALDIFLDGVPGYLDELEDLITGNEIVLARTKGVGVLSAEQAINASVTGPMLRASSVQWDLRKADPYEVYDRFEFDVPIGASGDTFDRYLVRVLEMRESLKIVRQAVRDIPDGPARTETPFNVRPPEGDAYAAVEGPKGELGFFLVSDGGISPYRCKIRAPSYINLTVLRDMLVGWKMADLITIFGSVDVVMGEVDR